MCDSGVYIRNRVFISKTSPESQLLPAACFVIENLKTPSHISTAAQEMKGQGHPSSEYPQLGSPWLIISKGDIRQAERPQETGTHGRGEITPAATLTLVQGSWEWVFYPSSTPGWGNWLLPIPWTNARPPSQCRNYLATIINVLCKQQFLLQWLCCRQLWRGRFRNGFYKKDVFFTSRHSLKASYYMKLHSASSLGQQL